jgi:hypothetical protein
LSIRELMRFRERDGVGIEFGFSWTYLADVSLLGNPRSFVSRSHSTARARYPGRCRRPRPSRSCAAPRASCSCATRAAADYTRRRRASTSPRRRAPRPTARPRTSPGPKARTNTTRASSSTRRVRASRRSHRPPISHRERPERPIHLAPPRHVLHSSHPPTFFLHFTTGFLVTVQASRKAKRVRNAVEEAKYMLGTCADPPSLGDSLPLHKAGELGCAFLPLLGYRPHAVVPYAR